MMQVSFANNGDAAAYTRINIFPPEADYELHGEACLHAYPPLPKKCNVRHSLEANFKSTY